MLSSDRISYRFAGEADAAAVRAHWNRPEVRRYLWDDEEVTPSMVEAALNRSSNAHRDFGGGLWCMYFDGGLVGTCGLLPVFPGLDSLLTESLDASFTALIGDAPMIEVLYSIEPERWGSGFAVEATRAMLDHARDTLGLAVVFGGTDVPNERSARVLGSAGMHEVARFDGGSGPLVYFARVNPPRA